MKIGMQTWGSHGDVRPFLALANGLHAAGHDVHLSIVAFTGGAWRHLPSRPGLLISCLDLPALDPLEIERIGRAAASLTNPVKQIATIMRLSFAPAEEAMFAAAQALCAESDVLVGHYFTHPLQTAAAHAGRSYVSVLLSHAGVPSDYSHPVGQPWIGKTGHRLLWWLTRRLLGRVLLPYPNRIRARLGMAPLTDIIGQSWLSPDLTLAAISPQIGARQPDWPDTVRLSGFLDRPDLGVDGALPPELDAFLAAGEAPVYMTFGSWMPRDGAEQAAALQLLTRAARLAGCRAIIQSDAAAACGFTSSDRILYVREAPHAAIFPHCRAVVHHGGAGTTQAATLAGAPSIVVAHISEQEHWARELRRLGIGAAPLTRRALSAVRLARRIRVAAETPGMRDRAAAIAARMQGEDGVAEAVRLIEQRFGAAAMRRAPPAQTGAEREATVAA
jgi:sterol 3beta-glucosyltransferase